MNTIANTTLKYNSIAAAAILVTFLLFYFMQLLVQLDENRDQRVNVVSLIDTSVPDFEPELILDIQRPEPIDVPVPQVIDPPAFVPNSNGLQVPTAELHAPEPPGLPNTSIPLSDNIVVPLIRITANYPQRALTQGIEGVVVVSFTVNELGDVVDPVILYAEPEGIFERATLQAISRWKYSAAMEDGIAVPTYDVRQRFSFELER